jgi:hypothetical protein
VGLVGAHPHATFLVEVLEEREYAEAVDARCLCMCV